MTTDNGQQTTDFGYTVSSSVTGSKTNRLSPAASNALGIEAASFASGTRNGDGNGNLGLGRNEASKDRAESPTRSGTPKRKLKVEN